MWKVISINRILLPETKDIIEAIIPIGQTSFTYPDYLFVKKSVQDMLIICD